MKFLTVCDKIIINGNIRPIEADDKRQILHANETMAGSALRVLGHGI